MAMLLRRQKKYLEAVETTASATASKNAQFAVVNLITENPAEVGQAGKGNKTF